MAGFAYLSGGKNGIEVATTAKVENDFSRLQICMEDWNAYAGKASRALAGTVSSSRLG